VAERIWQCKGRGLVKFKHNLAGSDHLAPVELVCLEGQARPGTLIVTENLLFLENACLQQNILAYTAPSEKVLCMIECMQGINEGIDGPTLAL
jgi:hypothetical protein